MKGAFLRFDPRVISSIWQSSYLPHKSNLLYGLAVVSLLAYAALGLSHHRGGSLSQSVMCVLGVTVFLLQGKPLVSSFVVKLFACAVLIQLASWGLSLQAHPQWAESSPKVHRLGVWFLIIPVAYLFGGQTRNIFLVWFVVFVGLALSPWLSGAGWSELEYGFKGRRVDFGIINAQHTSMLFGVAMLAILSLTYRVFKGGGHVVWFRFLIWAGALTVSFMGVAFTQTRGVWFGLVVSFVALLFILIYLFWVREKGETSLKPLGISALALLIVSMIGVVSLKDTINLHRFYSEQQTITDLLQGNKDFNHTNSAGVRVVSWMEAMEKVEERPLLGWGGRGRRMVVEQSEKLSDSFKAITRHLHSTYFDTLVNYGIAGLSLMLVLFGYLYYGSYRAWKNKIMPTDMFIFIGMFFPFWLVINTFESFMYYSSGSFVFSLVGGCALSYIWRDNLCSSAESLNAAKSCDDSI